MSSRSWAEFTVYSTGLESTVRVDGEEADEVIHQLNNGGIPVVLGNGKQED